MINVLNTIEVCVNPGATTVLVILMTMAVFFTCVGFIEIEKDLKKALLLISLGLSIIGLLITFIYEPFKSETHILATISEDASFYEIYENYEIIEQNGKIFTLKERTEDGA